ncbi:hypothetical protein IWX48DRAFT_352873 [Phyllosticta citricarpa]
MPVEAIYKKARDNVACTQKAERAVAPKQLTSEPKQHFHSTHHNHLLLRSSSNSATDFGLGSATTKSFIDMAPLLKLLLHAPLLLGVSLAQEPQNRPSWTDATPTTVPVSTGGGGFWNMILEPGTFPKMLSFWEGGNLTENYPVMRPSRTSAPKSRKSTSIMPPFSPTICPSHHLLQDLKDWATETTTSDRGICTDECVRQYLTPVALPVSSWNNRCKLVTMTVTYSGAPHWGDAKGLLIPKQKLYALAGLKTTESFKPSHCEKKKGKKTKGPKHKTTKKPKHSKTKKPKPSKTNHSKQTKKTNLHSSQPSLKKMTLFSPPAPTLARITTTSKGRKKHTPPPKPECTDFESCWRRCRKVQDRENKAMLVLLLLLGGFVGGAIAFIIIRKAWRRRNYVHRRERSGESGPATIVEEPVQEVVEVVTVEPRPEEQTTKEKVPAVIVEEATPTRPRSPVVADGTSDGVVTRDENRRLRVPRASGSDLHDSDGSEKKKAGGSV